jgi:hypothetical protein
LGGGDMEVEGGAGGKLTMRNSMRIKNSASPSS